MGENAENQKIEKPQRDKKGRFLPGHFNIAPCKFTDVKEVEKRIQEHIQECADLDVPVTYSGIALALGTTRKTLWDYCNRGGEIARPLKRVLTMLEMMCEQDLRQKNTQVSGTIFILKNHGWADKQEIDLTAKVSNLSDEELDAKLAGYGVKL